MKRIQVRGHHSLYNDKNVTRWYICPKTSIKYPPSLIPSLILPNYDFLDSVHGAIELGILRGKLSNTSSFSQIFMGHFDTEEQ